MLVSDVIELAQIQSEEIYDDPTWMKFINSALDDLTPVAKIMSTWELAAPAVVTAGKVEVDFSSPDNQTLVGAHEVLSLYFKVTSPAMPANDYMQLRRLPMNDYHSQGWKMVTNKITVQQLVKHPLDATVNIAEVQLMVDLYEKLNHVTTVIQDIYVQCKLPSQYHNLLVLFACAKSQQKEEELSDKNDFYIEYLTGKRNLAMDRTWEMEPQNRKLIRRLRVLGQLGVQQNQ